MHRAWCRGYDHNNTSSCGCAGHPCTPSMTPSARTLRQEDREVWLQRFLAFVRETWTSLDPEELDLFVVHISVSSPPRAVPHCVLLVARHPLPWVL